MTLDTKIAITGDIDDPEAVFRLAVSALLQVAQDPDREVKYNEPKFPSEFTVHQSTTAGQWLPALVEADYSLDGPLHTTAEWEEDKLLTPICTMTLSWDTAYSYAGPELAKNAAALHAQALLRFNTMLTAKYPDARVLWRNEFTGTWNQGIAEMSIELTKEEFTVLFMEMATAQKWFFEKVLPTIRARAKAQGDKVMLCQDHGVEVMTGQ